MLFFNNEIIFCTDGPKAHDEALPLALYHVGSGLGGEDRQGVSLVAAMPRCVLCGLKKSLNLGEI